MARLSVSSSLEMEDLVVVFHNADGSYAGESRMEDPRVAFCRLFNELNCGITASPSVSVVVKKTEYKH